MTASRNDQIARYVTNAIESAISCRTAVLEKLTNGNLSTWSTMSDLAEHDVDWDIWARVQIIADKHDGDWVYAIKKAREGYIDELLTRGVEQSTNPHSRALSATRQQQLRRFLSSVEFWT